ncbi:hypothetical protein [Neisseria dumasiana]|uniref:Type IV secretion protein Rhs n=1 Tax=Neisseria dumasiana TaxID=1931275 RepID=A0ABX3WKH3_9NEIS|nr:hypothetical protein [Neisseria dumasiana]OSI34340.1 hypothetical protein BV913_07280 [Neisseria dumasiana]UOO84845.1 hypothetical protein LVJ88_02195 [Neisseria dumasiana]
MVNMITFHIYAKIRTNAQINSLFYDVKVHDTKGSIILDVKKQPVKNNLIIGPHKTTRPIPLAAAPRYVKEIMLYKNVGGKMIPVRKHPFYIPYHLSEFTTEKVKPELLEATLDYFESSDGRGQEKKTQVSITNIKTRGLTNGEIKMLYPIFGDKIDYKKVKIHRKKFMPGHKPLWAMTPNGEMYTGEGHLYKDDYSTLQKSGGSLKHLFVHEMAHIWQYQKGDFVLARGAVLSCATGISGALDSIGANKLSDAVTPYEYSINDYVDVAPRNIGNEVRQRRFEEYNLEQQAEIIADYYALFIEKDESLVRSFNKKNIQHKHMYKEKVERVLKGN